MKLYKVNEVFPTLQGEGARAGCAAVFVRFSGCNLTCKADGPAGFDCDTEFHSGAPMTAAQIADAVVANWAPRNGGPSVVLTGGEPLLQVDDELLAQLRGRGCTIAIETNGTRPLPDGAEGCWISCSPKTAEHTLRITHANELRYVRHAGQELPAPSVHAGLCYLSPAWSDDAAARAANLLHCINLVLRNPSWRLSVQQHKIWRIR